MPLIIPPRTLPIYDSPLNLGNHPNLEPGQPESLAGNWKPNKHLLWCTAACRLHVHVTAVLCAVLSVNSVNGILNPFALCVKLGISPGGEQ